MQVKLFVITSMLCFIVLLSGCNITTHDKENSTSIYEVESTNLTGYSMEECGYMFDVSRVRDMDLVGYIELYSSLYGTTFEKHNLNGNYDDGVLFLRSGIGYYEMPCMYLQAFYKKDAENNGTVIIGDKKHSLKELSDYIIYEDDTIFVMDFFDIISPYSVEQILIQKIEFANKVATEEFAKSNSGNPIKEEYQPILLKFEDYQYLLDIASYCKSHFSELIFKESFED